MLDLTMWDDRTQIQTCVDSLQLLEGLKETSPECIDNVDAEACDPCTKHYDFFFEKYDVFVLQNLLSIVQKATALEQKKLDDNMALWKATTN